MHSPLLWLLPALLVTLVVAVYYVAKTKRSHATNIVMFSNYVESQRRRLERLDASGYSHRPQCTDTVRVLPSTATISRGRHRQV